jgi:hypothetical protein
MEKPVSFEKYNLQRFSAMVIRRKILAKVGNPA